MGASDCSRMDALRQVSNVDKEPIYSALVGYKYPLLCATYVLVTGAAFARVRRQPYTQSIKLEQYETIFKGTTLAAVVAGLAISGRGNKPRSAGRQATSCQRPTDGR